MQLYDGKSPITWVYRGKETVKQMAKDPARRLLTEVPCVLFDNGVGAVYSFRPLASMCESYGITYESAEDGYAKLIEAMSAVPTEDVDTTTEAIAELGVLISDLMDGQAELGTMIAALTEGV